MAIFFSSCSTEMNIENIKNLKYGTSFGECNGYCKHDLELKQSQITYNCTSWNASFEQKTFTSNLNITTSDSIHNNLNLAAFFNLPEVIGCPDCADGGAEWLEIELLNGKKHKVTFEYYHEPSVLKNNIVKLREILNRNICN